ncbi:GNAT family protein [Streptomyces canus]|uniref:GNAT family N-acetyltransferase n=1 Tax=Streptomyces canus TaxID=58343 RepID=UPI0033B9958A
MIAPIPPVVPAGRMADNAQRVLALPGGLERGPWRTTLLPTPTEDEARAYRADAGAAGEGCVNVDRGHAEIAYRVLPVPTDWALHDLGLHRLTLCHAVADDASCRVAEKAGFRLEGTMRHALLHADGGTTSTSPRACGATTRTT